MKATYLQKGSTLDYKNNTKKAIAAGDVIKIGNRIGVAGTDIAVGGLGTVHVDGVFELDKKDKSAMTVGTEVYLAEDGITEAASTEDGENVENNVRAGFVAVDSTAESAKVCVKINA